METMKTMKKAMMAGAGVLVLAVLLGAAAGCGDSSGTRGSRAAKTFEDGAEKYDPMQMRCPVCNGTPLKPGLHAEADGKRLYFDKKECVKKFKQNSGKYLKDYETYKERMKKRMQKRRGQ